MNSEPDLSAGPNIGHTKILHRNSFQALFGFHGRVQATETDIHLAFNPYHDELVNLEDSWSGEDIDKIIEGY